VLGVGVGVGIVLSLAGARAAKSLLYGLTPYDPLTLVAAIALIAIIAIAASSLPAQRASKLNPMVALRESKRTKERRKTKQPDDGLNDNRCCELCAIRRNG
jgi:hypothetical protein